MDRMDGPDAPTRTAPRARARAVPLVVGAAMFMEQLDGTVLSTALPSMGRTFGVDPLHMSVALTSYLVSLAVCIPASGWIADRLGSRTVFTAAVALFTFGSILCGAAPSFAFLVVARLLQGAGGAIMVPVGRLILLQTTAKSELISAMNWLLVPAAVGPMLGPPVGGLLVTSVGWRAIFYINVPIGALGLVLALRLIPQLRARASSGFDAPGMALVGVSLATLIFGLELGSRGALPIEATAFLLALAILSGAVYVRHARRVRAPILDLSLMRIPTFGLSVLAGAATRISVGASPLLLPLALQLGLGMSAAQSGLTTFVVSIGGLSMRGLSRRLLRRFGYRRVLIWNGAGAGAFSFGCIAFRPPVHHGLIDAVLFCGGFFNSLQFTAYNTIAYADVPPARMSSATSFYSTMQQVMLTLGICVGATAVTASVALRGRVAPDLDDLAVGFAVVGAIALLAPVIAWRFAADAGRELSGHR